MASHADWGSLHVDLLSTVLGQLSELCHEAAGGALSAADAARLLTSCSPNRHWRSVALRQVRCRMRLESKSDVAHLAKHPGLPCTQLELPQPPSGLPPWKARQAEAELAAAVRQLLGSTAFQRRCGSSLTALVNCPLAAAGAGEGLLHRFPALQQLVTWAASGGCSRAGGLSLGRCPPPLRRLTLYLPGGRVLRRASLPANLEHCEVVASSSCAGGSHCHLAPEEGLGGTGFWSTCRSLQVTAAAGGLLLSLDHCQVLRSCTALRVRGPPARSRLCGGLTVAPAAAEVAVSSTPPAGATLLRWLQVLARLFAATPLQLLEVQAGAASLHTAPDGSQPLLLVGDGPSCWQPAQLTAAPVPAGNQQLECLGGLVAELRRCDDDFVLCVRRCDVV